MIEIEVFQYEPSSGTHALKIWLNGSLTHANDLCSVDELLELREALHNELRWLEEYLEMKGWLE